MAKEMPLAKTARVTIRSIAEKAGVSISAVSSVLNNRQEKRRIPAETVERIRTAISELHYFPNISARQLKGGHAAKNTLVLAVLTSLQAPLSLVGQFVFALHEAGSRKELQDRGGFVSVTIDFFDAGLLKNLPGLLSSEFFNAAILTNTVPEDDRYLLTVRPTYPLVLVNREVPGYTCVLEDSANGAKAAKLLLGKNRKRPAVLAANPLTAVTRARIDSFRAACSERGLPEVPVLRCRGFSGGAARTEMARFLEGGGSLDSLYVVTDSLAPGAYQAMKTAGLRIPEDVSVVGVGDDETAALLDPPMTTMGVAPAELGSVAAQMLLDKLLGVVAGSPETKRISSTLRRRSSV